MNIYVKATDQKVFSACLFLEKTRRATDKPDYLWYGIESRYGIPVTEHINEWNLYAKEFKPMETWQLKEFYYLLMMKDPIQYWYRKLKQERNNLREFYDKYMIPLLEYNLKNDDIGVINMADVTGRMEYKVSYKMTGYDFVDRCDELDAYDSVVVSLIDMYGQLVWVDFNQIDVRLVFHNKHYPYLNE